MHTPLAVQTGRGGQKSPVEEICGILESSFFLKDFIRAVTKQ
jgi:hypothetical protein